MTSLILGTREAEPELWRTMRGLATLTLLARWTTSVSSSLEESRSRKDRGSSGPVTAIGGMSSFGDDVLKVFMAASTGDLVVSFDIRFSKTFFSFAGSSALKVLVSGLYIGSVGLSP